MKKLIFGFFILLLAIGLGYLIHKDSGYVLITYSNWSIEMSFWLATLLVIVGFLLLYLLFRMIHHASNLGDKWHRWDQKHKHRKARQQTQAGICQLAEGYWKKAETQLIKAAANNSMPLINYLEAAKAAQAQKAYDRRDEYFNKAYALNNHNELAIGLFQAELQTAANQNEQALATLMRLNQLKPNHSRVLYLLQQVYLALHDWTKLQSLIPSLKKTNALPNDAIQSLQQTIYHQLLAIAAATGQVKSLTTTWNNFPRNWQNHPSVAAAYANALIQLNHSEQAIPLIEQILKKQWDHQLVTAYGLAKTKNDSKRIVTAENWLQQHPNDPILLLCLGRLAINEQFWGKARHYLEMSLTQKPCTHTYQELGRVFEALGEKEKAFNYYRSGLYET